MNVLFLSSTGRFGLPQDPRPDTSLGVECLPLHRQVRRAGAEGHRVPRRRRERRPRRRRGDGAEDPLDGGFGADQEILSWAQEIRDPQLPDRPGVDAFVRAARKLGEVGTDRLQVPKCSQLIIH